jgi:hypothetical protein
MKIWEYALSAKNTVMSERMTKMNKKVYLGDGLYVEFEGAYAIHVTSENGIEVLDRVVFDARMVDKLKEFTDAKMTKYHSKD